MSEYVVDAAAAVKALSGKDASGEKAYQRISQATCHAPHLLDAEVGHILRPLERLREIDHDIARASLAALPRLVKHRCPHIGRVAALAWETRHTITFYDGLYVALATVLELPLLTADVKLANAPGLSCEVELVG